MKRRSVADAPGSEQEASATCNFESELLLLDQA